MLIVTTDSIADKKIVKVLGLVKGSTVRSKNIGKDIGSSLKGIVGGEINSPKCWLKHARLLLGGWQMKQRRWVRMPSWVCACNQPLSCRVLLRWSPMVQLWW